MSETIPEVAIEHSYGYQDSKELCAVVTERHGWYSAGMKWYCRLGGFSFVIVSMIVVEFMHRHDWITRGEARASTMGIVLGFVAIGLLAAGYQLLWRRLWNREFAQAKPHRITFDRLGVHWKSEDSFAEFAWRGIVGVHPRSTGVMFYIGSGRGFFVPDSALPAPVSQKDFLNRVAEWRGEA